VSLPTGTVTFLRTDVEGSMAIMRTVGSDWDDVNAVHLGIVREAIDRHGGTVVRTEGDAVFAVFPEAGAAVRAAADGQRMLDGQAWPTDARIRVRMGLHSGEAHLAGDDYGGFDVNRAARIAAVGHGGQIVLSETTQVLVGTSLPPDVSLRDLGRHVLRDLPFPEHLWQVDVAGRRTDFPALRVAGSTKGNLPERMTTFVGRSSDIREIGELLESNRLVTLTGPGGIGKTSLAVEAARERVASMPDGAWFVALDAVTDPSLVPTVIARAIGLFDGIDRPAAEGLPSFLATQSLILVLDNFEQVMDAAGDVARLLRSSPDSRFIVTSRSPLRISGEQEYPVRPLPVDGTGDGLAASDDPAVQLFADRARSVLPGWEPGPDAPIVVEICALVDGLPLGIELAAARLSLLPARAIRDRLASHLPLPGSGPRDAPARQKTLEGMIGWSHDLLSPDDQRILHDLGAFEGTFDAEQAEAVIADAGGGARTDVLDRLIALAERSLIARDLPHVGDDARLAGSGIRFRMLTTVQAFAADRLVDDGRQTEVRDRHAAAYLDVIEAAAPHLFTSRQPPWLDRLDLDASNLRAALRWMIASGDVESALRFVAASWRYWLATGRLDEGAERVTAVFAMPGAERPSIARVRALAAAGGIAYWRDDTDAARRWYTAQRDEAILIGDAAATADAFFNLSGALFATGDLDPARGSAEEARRRFVELGDEISVNRVDMGIAHLIMSREGPEAVSSRLRGALERAMELDDAPYVAMGCGSLAWAAWLSGDTATARPLALQAILGYHALRDAASTTISLTVGALLALDRGRPEDAAALIGAHDALSLRYGVRPPVGLAAILRTADPLGPVRAALPADVYDAEFARGTRMTLGEVVDLVATFGDATPGA
jgi:predicted ATPase/class 3 adenylate cyclase